MSLKAKKLERCLINYRRKKLLKHYKKFLELILKGNDNVLIDETKSIFFHESFRSISEN